MKKRLLLLFQLRKINTTNTHRYIDGRIKQLPEKENFYKLLFEVSHEIRHNILLLLKDKPMRITEIARDQDLHHPEIRRHITRLQNIRFIKRDIDGYYHLTTYGETSLLLFKDFMFLTENRQYFENHSLNEIPTRFVKKIKLAFYF